jgi:hypothetical protein
MPTETSDTKRILKKLDIPSQSVVERRMDSDAYWRDESKINIPQSAKEMVD